jgi:hypothetical protein
LIQKDSQKGVAARAKLLAQLQAKNQTRDVDQAVAEWQRLRQTFFDENPEATDADMPEPLQEQLGALEQRIPIQTLERLRDNEQSARELKKPAVSAALPAVKGAPRNTPVELPAGAPVAAAADEGELRSAEAGGTSLAENPQSEIRNPQSSLPDNLTDAEKNRVRSLEFQIAGKAKTAASLREQAARDRANLDAHRGELTKTQIADEEARIRGFDETAAQLDKDRATMEAERAGLLDLSHKRPEQTALFMESKPASKTAEAGGDQLSVDRGQTAVVPETPVTGPSTAQPLATGGPESIVSPEAKHETETAPSSEPSGEPAPHRPVVLPGGGDKQTGRPRPDRPAGGSVPDTGGAPARTDRPDQGQVDQSDRLTESDQSSAVSGSSIPPAETSEAKAPANVGNFQITDPDFLSRGGAKTKFYQNVEALRTLRAIQAEGRLHATLAEQQKLAFWTGWGQFPQVFDEWNTEWATERSELRGLIPDPKEWDAARRSTFNPPAGAPSGPLRKSNFLSVTGRRTGHGI